MAAEGYKVIFGQGGEFAEYFSEVAPDYPEHLVRHQRWFRGG